MSNDSRITFFHAPNSRSGGTRALLEEPDADYELHALDLKKNESRSAEYLAINPMGKVPAIRDGEALITEQVAVYVYLADRFPAAGLAPSIGDPLRGPYLRWIAYYGSSFEPAVVDRALKREPAAPSTSPYGDFDSMLKTLTDQIERGPFILGERFSAADVLWGTALNWTTKFGVVPESSVIRAYIDRITQRPAMQRAAKLDEELAASQEA